MCRRPDDVFDNKYKRYQREAYIPTLQRRDRLGAGYKERNIRFEGDANRPVFLYIHHKLAMLYRSVPCVCQFGAQGVSCRKRYNKFYN